MKTIIEWNEATQPETGGSYLCLTKDHKTEILFRDISIIPRTNGMRHRPDHWRTTGYDDHNVNDGYIIAWADFPSADDIKEDDGSDINWWHQRAGLEPRREDREESL